MSKGVVDIYRILRKLLFFLIVLIFSSCLFIISSSYTLAEIRNNAVVGITSSENALISLPSHINGGKIQKELGPDFKHFLPATGHIQVSIKNNMNTKIRVAARISDYKEDMLLFVYELCNTIEIQPGCSGTMDFVAVVYPQTKAGARTFDLTFKANWDGGNATIESQMNIEITEPEHKTNDSLNSMTTLSMGGGNQTFIGEYGEEKNKYYETNQNAGNQTWMDILMKQQAMVDSKEIETDEFKNDENPSRLDAANYEKDIADMYQRCIRAATGIEDIINQINNKTGQLNGYNKDISFQQSTPVKSKYMEIYQEGIRQYYELQALRDRLSDIAKSDSGIAPNDVEGVSQQLQLCEANYEALYQSYMVVISRIQVS